MPGHNKASWEQQAGQADSLRWEAWVVWHRQVLPLLAAAEAKYLIADAERGEKCPRMYGGYKDVEDALTIV